MARLKMLWVRFQRATRKALSRPELRRLYCKPESSSHIVYDYSSRMLVYLPSRDAPSALGMGVDLFFGSYSQFVMWLRNKVVACLMLVSSDVCSFLVSGWSSYGCWSFVMLVVDNYPLIAEKYLMGYTSSCWLFLACWLLSLISKLDNLVSCTT